MCLCLRECGRSQPSFSAYPSNCILNGWAQEACRTTAPRDGEFLQFVHYQTILNKFCIILTELSAQGSDGVESFNREVDSGVQISQIRKLYSELFLHRSEMENRICVDAALIQGGPCPQEPLVLYRPPQGVLGPVHCDFCNKIVETLARLQNNLKNYKINKMKIS
jgi:hypothetical protein